MAEANDYESTENHGCKIYEQHQYSNTKSEMQLLFGFTPRRSGMSGSRFESGTSDCDCTVCIYKTRKGKYASPDRCICLRERFAVGCVPLT